MISKGISLTDSSADIDRAVALLRAGELIAFPTETVYGLGADASNPDAVRKIFQLKGRPSSHPVIVHIPDVTHLSRWAIDVPSIAQSLAAAFWPGPLTLVLKRAAAVSDVVTGGQDTVAVRVPRHPVAQQLLRVFDGGVAAPSANRFGHVSPTLAQHVRDEFGDALLVLEGVDCEIGLESTIVSCVGEMPRLLRPGGITLSQLRSVAHDITDVVVGDVPRAPGMLEKHYSPTTPLQIMDKTSLYRSIEECVKRNQKVAVLAMHATDAVNGDSMSWINAGSDPAIYAHSLYANLRTLDKLSAALIVVEQVPVDERWMAVRDRLQRAATPAT